MKVANPAHLLALLLLAGLSLPAMAFTRTWPGNAPCDTTLQNCVNSVLDGDTILIASNTITPQPLSLGLRNLTLRAANGYHPTLTHYALYVGSAQNPDKTVTVEGITLDGGFIDMTYTGTGTAHFTLRNVEASKISVKLSLGTMNVTLYNNRVVGTPESDPDSHTLCSLCIFNGYGTLNADVYFNHITSSSEDTVIGSGILVNSRFGSTSTVKLLGNVVRGDYSVSGITASQGLVTPDSASDLTAAIYNNVVVCPESGSSTGTGIGLVVEQGSVDAQVINNTVSGCANGIGAAYLDPNTNTGAITGMVHNNLVVGANYGLSLHWPLANDYNLINATHTSISGFTLGSHTITAPAKLVAAEIPRLTAASPALDAADTTTLSVGLLANGLPGLDADGLRRFKGPGSSPADIGAYEYGDLSFLHTASANSSSHVSAIFNPITDGDGSLNLFATPNYDVGDVGPDVDNNHPFGSWFNGSNWTLFEQDTSVDMPDNAHFNVFVPGAGGGVFRHTASASNTSAWSTQLNDVSINNRPDRIVLVNQNFSAGAQYNNHPVGVAYYGGGTGSWLIFNLDQLDSRGDMPVGAGFSVYAQAPSPNAFRVTHNYTEQLIVLDHPLLNNTPCAQVAATRMLGTNPTSSNFDVSYDSAAGRWGIFSYGGSIAAGDRFNVVVNPAQVELCRYIISDTIFADGFE